MAIDSEVLLKQGRVVFFNNVDLEYEYEMKGFDMEERSYLLDLYPIY